MTRTSAPLEVARDAFRAMGTEVTLIAAADADPGVFARAAAGVRRCFAVEEARFSRFRSDSELSMVNARAGSASLVSPAFAEVVGLALAAAAATEGRFDPTVLGAVVAAGYDRDFDEVLAGARAVLSPPEPCGRWRGVRLEGDVVTVPTGAGLDLGGLAKGWTVDRAAEGALDAGLEWAVVNAGGDLRVVGASPVIDVAVEDPEDRDAEILRLGLEAGALATSSITRRSWGPHRHHLIDPSTGRPADTGVLQATVLAPTCAEAEVRSKDALLAGDDALSRTTGVLVMQDGTIVTNLGPTTEVAA